MTRYVWDHSRPLLSDDHKPDPMATVDHNNRLVFESPSVCRQCGRSVELVHPDDVWTADDRVDITIATMDALQ